jgi:hypothetical protein
VVWGERGEHVGKELQENLEQMLDLNMEVVVLSVLRIVW